MSEQCHWRTGQNTHYRNDNNDAIFIREQNNCLTIEKCVSADASLEHTIITFEDKKVTIKTFERRPRGLILVTTDITYVNTPTGLKEQKIANVRYAFTDDKISKVIHADASHLEPWEIINLLSKHEEETFIEAESNICNMMEAEITQNDKLAVRFNNVIKTPIFEGVTGENRLLRLLNLYNGTVTESILRDLYNIHNCELDERAFAFCELKGVLQEENELVGASAIPKPNSYYELLNNFFIKQLHIKCPDLDTRHTIIKYILFKPDMNQIAKRELEMSLDMPYSEFEKLDLREQERLIRHKKGFRLMLKPNVSNKYLYNFNDKK